VKAAKRTPQADAEIDRLMLAAKRTLECCLAIVQHPRRATLNASQIARLRKRYKVDEP
jgi:hypothetical protein